MAPRAIREDLETLGLVIADIGHEALAALEPEGHRIVLALAPEELANPDLQRVLAVADLADLLAGDGHAALVDGHVPRAEDWLGDRRLVLLVPVEVLLELELALELLVRGGDAEVHRQDGPHEGVAIGHRRLEIRALRGGLEHGILHVRRRVLSGADIALGMDLIPAAGTIRLSGRIRGARDLGADAQVPELLRRVARLGVDGGDEALDTQHRLVGRLGDGHGRLPLCGGGCGGARGGGPGGARCVAPGRVAAVTGGAQAHREKDDGRGQRQDPEGDPDLRERHPAERASHARPQRHPRRLRLREVGRIIDVGERLRLVLDDRAGRRVRRARRRRLRQERARRRRRHDTRRRPLRDRPRRQRRGDARNRGVRSGGSGGWRRRAARRHAAEGMHQPGRERKGERGRKSGASRPAPPAAKVSRP